MEILLGTNAECTRNFSHGVISKSKKLSYKKRYRSELFVYRELEFFGIVLEISKVFQGFLKSRTFSHTKMYFLRFIRKSDMQCNTGRSYESRFLSDRYSHDLLSFCS
jgi:hypothetical protein